MLSGIETRLAINYSVQMFRELTREVMYTLSDSGDIMRVG
jgi:hypothetical protein